MGKADIYFFGILVVAALLVGAVVGSVVLVRRGVAAAKRRHRRSLDVHTPWRAYLDVADMVVIGMRRAALDNDELVVFEGPIVLHELPRDHPQFDTQEKYLAVRDLAALRNDSREEALGM